MVETSVIDKNLGALNTQTREYNKTKQAMEENPLPMGTIAGSTADTVNAGGAGAPRTRAEFLARGGLGNTMLQTVNTLSQKRDRHKLEGMYEQLLQAGEQGARNAYEDVVNTYGEEMKEWIPTPARFYDADGIFMPHRYYEAVNTGIDAYKKDKTAKAKKAAEYQAVGAAIGSSDTRAGASSQIYKAGYNAGDHSGPIGFINEPKPVTDEDRAKAEHLRAQAYKLRKEGDGVGDVEGDKALNSANQQRIQLRTQVNTITGTLKGLIKQKEEGIPNLDNQISALELQLKDLKDEEKKADITLKEIAKNKKTPAQKATWGGIKAVEIDPEVSRIADLIDGSINANKNTEEVVPGFKNLANMKLNINPSNNQQFSGKDEIITTFVENFDRNTPLDPIVKEEVRKELQRRYNVATPEDMKLIDALRQRGVPEDRLSEAVAKIKAQGRR